MSFWSELKRRKVVRVVMAYAVVAWIVVEVVTSLEEPLGLPVWTDTLVIVLLGIGFIVAAMLAWAFDVTPDGVQRTPPAESEARTPAPPVGRYAATALGAGLLGAAAVWLFNSDSDAEWLNQAALPQVEAALAEGDWQAAFASAVEIEERLDDAPALEELWPRMAWTTAIRSDPPGAMVARRPYAGPEESWQPLGRTPLEGIRVPFGVSELRFELEGHAPLHRTIGHGMVNFPLRDLMVSLESEGSALAGKVLVPGFELAVGNERVSANEFHLGLYEVTNEEFKAFVDAGGYDRPNLWEPFAEDGRTLSWEEGVGAFVDATGRHGPSGWAAGDYPAGKGDHPVEGVSWYEAMAYARWRGEELPTAEHFLRSLNLRDNNTPWVLEQSNFGGVGTRSVRESRAIGEAGAYDLAGNVREWTSTRVGEDYVILGGGWNDPYYVVDVENTSAPPMNRIAGNGFRLAVTTDERSAAAAVRAVVRPPGLGRHPVPEREPVDADIFAAYRSLFDYERGPLDEEIEARIESRSWTHEVVSFNAGYRGERVTLHLYLPTTGSPPFQTVIYWPGWDTFSNSVPVDEYFSEQADFIVGNGRALAFPVYNGTFERGGDGFPDFGSTANRDVTLDGVKDLRRSLDYLETRPEIDARSFAYYGYSWGGVTAPVVLAHEDRLRVAVVHIGGSPDVSTTPEIDPVNALPRVEVPFLLLSGEFDSIMPIENAVHYYELLGAAEKKHAVTRGGHFVPRIELVRESLDWLDRHLGPPR